MLKDLPHPKPSNFSKNLEAARKERGLTYAGLARISNINKSLIFNWAQGVEPRNLKTLIALSQALKIRLDDLIFEQNEMREGKHFTVTITEIADE